MLDPKYTENVLTVGEFIDNIQKLIKAKKIKKTDILVLASDGEGNTYSPVPKENYMNYGENCRYKPNNTWNGELTLDEEEIQLLGKLYIEKETIPAVCLWPTD